MSDNKNNQWWIPIVSATLSGVIAVLGTWLITNIQLKDQREIIENKLNTQRNITIYQVSFLEKQKHYDNFIEKLNASFYEALEAKRTKEIINKIKQHKTNQAIHLLKVKMSLNTIRIKDLLEENKIKNANNELEKLYLKEMILMEKNIKSLKKSFYRIEPFLSPSDREKIKTRINMFCIQFWLIAKKEEKITIKEGNIFISEKTEEKMINGFIKERNTIKSNLLLKLFDKTQLN